MLRPSSTTLRSFADSLGPGGKFFLSDVRLDIPDATTAIFAAKLNAPAGAKVWVRAWIANPSDGTLAEAASEALTPGQPATLTVKLTKKGSPTYAYMRLESAPLHTEHVVSIRLPDGPRG